MSPAQVLASLPQQRPFRYVDEIVELDENRVLGTYTFRRDEFFYGGHFPGNPVTPGVIILESMAQVGVVALGIYLLSLEVDAQEVSKWTTYFADAQVEFLKPVLPGETVLIRGEKLFWRRRKLRSKLEMCRRDGTLIASATASGIGVRHE
jgi:3-hydroxyacyl-[acyl-carrier-protein] dehydratase